jgi:FixJ family two-component response regulator
MIKRLFKIGAQDYIRKPAGLAQLKQVIRHAITKAIEIKSLKIQEAIL